MVKIVNLLFFLMVAQICVGQNMNAGGKIQKKIFNSIVSNICDGEGNECKKLAKKCLKTTGLKQQLFKSVKKVANDQSEELQKKLDEIKEECANNDNVRACIKEKIVESVANDLLCQVADDKGWTDENGQLNFDAMIENVPEENMSQDMEECLKDVGTTSECDMIAAVKCFAKCPMDTNKQGTKSANKKKQKKAANKASKKGNADAESGVNGPKSSKKVKGQGKKNKKGSPKNGSPETGSPETGSIETESTENGSA